MQTEDGKTTEGIYENAEVIRTKLGKETNDSNTMRLESPELTRRDSVKIRGYRAAAVCLVLLCALLLTAVIVLWVHMDSQRKNYTEDRRQLLTKIINLTEERHQLLTNNTDLLQLNEHLEELKNKLWNFTQDGWIYYQFSFYCLSTEEMNWNESRANCTERGADLLMINSKEEQEFVKKIAYPYNIWIGLTDTDEEGIWKWVDGSTLTSGFWNVGQPNGRIIQNCAVSSLIWWADTQCNFTNKWICEKSILPVILP
ncbi:CD209 antigen-like protein C [Carassius gibelio]|uniref:CD209 antigen-like protein C n=1 Tax=Carassius gibelio TaxID=101364 RepID=UPI002278994A|nr:CD209 antigen-like protein C [Carassius gibelio]